MSAARRRVGEPPRARRPWWLENEVHCRHCLLHHAMHLELRCTRCDGIVCRDCAVTVRTTTQVVCPDCVLPRER